MRTAASRLPAGFLFLLALAGAAWFFYAVRLMLAPFVIAAILAYLLNPVVVFFEVRGLRRDTVVLILFSLLIAAAVGTAYWGLVAMWQDLPALRAQWPVYMRTAAETVDRIQLDLGRYMWWIEDRQVLKRSTTGAMAWVEHYLWETPHFVRSAITIFVNILLAPFVAFFFSRGGGKIAQMVLDACPGVWVERFLGLFNKFEEILGNYTRGIILEALLVGVFSWMGLFAINLRYAALIGIIAGLGNMVPFLGPFVGGVMGLVVAVFQFGTLEPIAKVLLVFTVVHYVDSYILQPLIMKRSVNLNPVTVVFALLCGGQLAGLWGLLFAVPVASLVKEASVICYDWYRAERGLISYPKDFSIAAEKPWVV